MKLNFSNEIDIQLFIEMIFVVIIVAITNAVGNIIIGYPISLNYKWAIMLVMLSFALKDSLQGKRIKLWRTILFTSIIYGLLPLTFISFGGLNILIISYIFTISVAVAFLCNSFQRVFLIMSLFLISSLLYSIQIGHYGISHKILSDMITPSAISKDMPLQLIITLSIATYTATRFSNVWRKEHATLLLYSEELKEKNNALEHMASHDELTSVYNRHYLTHYYKNLSAFNNGHLMILDIDDFKVVNDTYGHNTGDALLKTIASSFESLVADNGFVSRIGGDEFVIFLYDFSEESLTTFMKQFELVFSNLYIGDKHQITISGGVIKIDTTKSLSENLNVADKLLYKAKRNGKQKIELLNHLDIV